jgi:signal transduction histidine kinase
LLPAAVYTCDRQGVITYYNQRAVDLWGRAPRQGDTGERFCGSFRLFHLDGSPLPHHLTPMADVLRTGRPVENQEVVIERPDGSRVTVNASITPLYDEKGRQAGALNVFQDISPRKRAEQALAHEREMLEKMIDHLPVGLWFIDAQGQVSYANPAARAILGGAAPADFAQPPVYRGWWLESGRPVEPGEWGWARAIAYGEPCLNEVIEIECFDGSHKIINQSAIPVLGSEGGLQGAVVVTEDVTGRLHTEEALRRVNETLEMLISERTRALVTEIEERTRAQAELAEFQSRLMDSVEAERIRLGRELHDGPMQEIYSLQFSLHEQQQDARPDDRTRLVWLAGKLEEINDTLRSIARDLRPPTLAAFGLEKAILEHANRFRGDHPNLALVLDLESDQQSLPERTRLTLYRIYQVALTNVVRHAQASQVVVRLRLDESRCELEVEDDGQGFVLPERLIRFAHEGHLGLAGAYERAEAIGGRLEVRSAPGQGTVVRCVAPR